MWCLLGLLCLFGLGGACLSSLLGLCFVRLGPCIGLLAGLLLVFVQLLVRGGDLVVQFLAGLHTGLAGLFLRGLQHFFGLARRACALVCSSPAFAKSSVRRLRA